jgi:hypothetical protein
MSSVLQTYRYDFASFVSQDVLPRLSLATSAADAISQPHFFEGRLLHPRLTAELLTAVHLVVGARYFVPANTLAKALAMADPVVTCAGGWLRFEGFSSCCSTYVRADLMPQAYDGQTVGKGTTNVDFNAPMRAALARVSDAGGLSLAVGRDALTLKSAHSEVVERKVKLPQRWLRGMVEVQSYQAGMRQRIEMSGIEALRLFRTLPKSSTSRTPLWLSRGTAGLHCTSLPVETGVRITDTTRLRALQPLLPRAKSLTIFADDAQQASAWVLDLGSARLTVVLSAEVWRGFSGEGQALLALLNASGGPVEAALARLRAKLAWQANLDPALLARELSIDMPVLANALRVLGASGLVGFDVLEGRYFHRELPFDLSMVEDMHPRLADARALIEAGAVTVLQDQLLQANVQSGDVIHRVRDRDGTLQCTCPWYAKHKGSRGPCKHVLAAQARQIDNPA